MVLAAIVQHWRLNLTAPSMRELCAAFAIESTNGIECHLQALEKKGFIQRRHNKRSGGDKAQARSITIPGMAVTFPEWVDLVS